MHTLVTLGSQWVKTFDLSGMVSRSDVYWVSFLCDDIQYQSIVSCVHTKIYLFVHQLNALLGKKFFKKVIVNTLTFNILNPFPAEAIYSDVRALLFIGGKRHVSSRNLPLTYWHLASRVVVNSKQFVVIWSKLFTLIDKQHGSEKCSITNWLLLHKHLWFNGLTEWLVGRVWPYEMFYWHSNIDFHKLPIYSCIGQVFFQQNFRENPRVWPIHSIYL